MSSSYSNGVGGVQGVESIAKLSLLLHDALTAAGGPLPSPHYILLLSDPPLCTLSNPLLKALLVADLDSSHDSGEVLVFANQHRNEIAHTLETTSLQCFSAYLLKLPENEGFELGLYLLTDEPEYTASPDSLRSQVIVSESATLMPLVQQSLLEKTYAIFTDVSGDARMRRMAGKVLAEIVSDSEEHCQMLKELNGDEYVKHIIDILCDMDVILSFQSSIILQILSKSISFNDWDSDEPYSRILSHLQTRGNAVERFYSYVRAVKQHNFSISGKARSGSANSALPICYLVESDGAHAKGLPRGTVLLVFCADGMDLIHCGRDTSGHKLNYMAIRLTCPTQTRCTFSSERGGQKRLLSVNIHGHDLIKLNDQQCDSHTINLGIRSEYDSTGILKRFEAIGIQCQTIGSRTSPSRRRSSSVVISMDTEDEMVSGFFQSSVVAFRTAADWASPPARVKYLTSMLEQSEYIPGTASDSATESSLTDLTRTPSLHGTSSSRVGDSSRSTSPKSRTEIQRNKKARVVERAISQDDKDLLENGPASNTRSKSSQRSKSVTRNSVLRPVPHNTQESLIFSRRHPKGKLYTALRTKVVDWDEDLRASDGSLEPQPQEDADFTSVSSPSSSGARYTFNKSSTGSWTSSARKKQATKTRRQSGTGSKMKPKRRVNNKAKLLLTQHRRSRNGNHQRSPDSSSSEKEPERSTAAGKHEICNGTPRSLASESLAGANNSLQACKTEDISTRVFESPLPQNSNTSNRQSMFESSLREGQHLHGNTPGRGQSVAEKLIAALRESNTPNQHHNDINANEQLSCDNEHGVEVVTESHEMQNEPNCCKSTVEQQQCKCDKQDVINSWTSAMSQDGISGDELYPVRLYSGDSSDESRFGSSQGPGEHNRILRKGEAMSGAEDGEEYERIREAPSLASSSSVEPLSRESTPEAHYSSPSLKESKPSLSHSYRENATTAADRFKIHQPPPKRRRSSACLGHSEAFTLSSSLNLNLCATHPEEITTKDYCSRNPKFGDIGAARPIVSALGKCPESDITHATEFLESSAKTIVDKNGSPRLMQQASMGTEEHITLKRQDAFPRMGQRSLKRTRGISQDNKQHITYHTTENQTREPPCTFQLAPRESDTDFSASRTTLTEERGHQSCASHPHVSAGERHLLKVVASVSPGSRQEQHQTQERVPGLHGLAAAAEPEQKVAFEVSKSTAGQVNWQTTLQELHEGMERTLRNNNEYLFRQIESEKATIKEVLNGYREQCHSVLDQLFKAQIERTRLCKQQIDSIKQQHADVCQELIRRLKENERTLVADWES